MRTVLAGIVLAAALLSPLAPALPSIGHPPVLGARLVEGHVVDVVMGSAGPGQTRLDGAPVGRPLVLTDDGTMSDAPGRHDLFPGVRWTNDQFLVEPVHADGPSTTGDVWRREFVATAMILVGDTDGATARYPCVGAILAVPAGAADPRERIADATYEESYLITDPNDHTFFTDVWRDADGPIWTVAIVGNLDGTQTLDNGSSNCTPFVDVASAREATSLTGYGASGLRYNAEIAVFLCDDDACPTTSASSVTHGVDGALSTDSVADGNSHPANPIPAPFGRAYKLHGGSGPAWQSGTHATTKLDIYYGITPQPPGQVRNERIVDTEGSLAPYG